MSYFMQVNWTIGGGEHAKREEEIRVEMEMGVARAAAAAGTPPPPLLLNGLQSGLPNCCAFIRNLCRIPG